MKPLIVALLLACAACDDQLPPTPTHDAGPDTPPIREDMGPRPDAGGGYGTGPGPDPGRKIPPIEFRCWTRCYLNPCSVQCPPGEVPVEGVTVQTWGCAVDVGQCDGLELDAGAEDAGL